MLLTAVNEGISPVPEAAKPMAELVLVQLNIVDGTGPVTIMEEVVIPLQKD